MKKFAAWLAEGYPESHLDCIIWSLVASFLVWVVISESIVSPWIAVPAGVLFMFAVWTM